MVLEDCAQAFAGWQYLGHPEADVSMFSFGPIKTASALGGAVLRVRDGELLQRMRAVQASLPVQSRWTYLQRLLKYAMLKAVSPRLPCAMVVGLCRIIGHDYDRMINGSVRGFPGPKFLERIRHQPSPALLGVLLRRLQTYDMRRVERRTANGRWLAEALQRRVPCPGAEVAAHTHWVFPVLCDDPLGLVAVLREAGFDATQGQSLCVVPPPADRPQLQCRAARHALDKIVFLPLYPELPAAEVRRMAEVVLQSLSGATAVEGCMVPSPSGRGLG
jgi:dTDP-4-amino-4,6-dideoxygalactose transaminase